MKCPCCGEEMVQSSNPPFPDLQAWKGITSKEEVDKNWDNMLKRKALLEEALKTDNPERLKDTCEDWEHKYCECISLCPDSICSRKKELKEGKK